MCIEWKKFMMLMAMKQMCWQLLLYYVGGLSMIHCVLWHTEADVERLLEAKRDDLTRRCTGLTK